MSAHAETEWLREAAGSSVLEFYDAIGVILPRRQGDEAAVSCFANPNGHERGDRRPSCSVNLITGLWNCKGCGESGNAYQAALAVGYSEGSARQLARSHGLFLERVPDPKGKPKLPGERELKKWRLAFRTNGPVLLRLQELKGWEPQAACRLGLGWDGERIIFPIRNARYKIVGAVRYLPGGSPKSKAVPGSKRDLFPAPESIRKHHPLFLVEGEGDAVAVWSLGFKAVAIPGAGSWRREWGMRLAGRRVVMLSDCDAPGRALAQKVSLDAPAVRIVDLEPSADDGSDIGDWVADAFREGGLAQLRRVLGRLVAA